MPHNPPRHALIVGAGLAGSLMACYLARAGWRVSVYERRPDPRAAGYAGGRSINLALSARGLAGLRGVGLDEAVLANDAIRMPGRMIHLAGSAERGVQSDELPSAPSDTPHSAPCTHHFPPPIFQPYSKDPVDAIHSVSRGGLNLTLINAADAHENVSLHFDHPCLDVDLDAGAGLFQSPGGEAVRIAADLVIGADGAFSAVRARMQKIDRFDYSQSYLEHGYKELHIPPAANPGGRGSRRAARATHAGGASGSAGASPSQELFAMEPHALHIWPRGGSMMIALPNRDGSFTCTLFWPFTGPHSFENLRTAEQVLAFFREHYPDAVPLMPTLAEDYLHNPTSSLVTVRCRPWQQGGKVVLLGDAAHAIVPFYGQGMNAAFEDCLALSESLAAHPQDQTAALEAYQAGRKPNADAIAEMAVENFVEMRDKVGDPAFLYKKRVEQTVHALFPDRVTPQYNLVSFSTVPYAEARRRGRALDAVLERIVARLPRESAAGMSDEAWRGEVERLAQTELAATDGPGDR